MKFSIALIVAAATAAFAAPTPEPQGGVCFDSFDCLLSGGGSCINFKCSNGENTTPTGGVCFDSFDCLLSGGGSCVNFACVKENS